MSPTTTCVTGRWSTKVSSPLSVLLRMARASEGLLPTTPLTPPELVPAAPSPHHSAWSASQLQKYWGSAQFLSSPQAQRWMPGREPPQ